MIEEFWHERERQKMKNVDGSLAEWFRAPDLRSVGPWV